MKALSAEEMLDNAILVVAHPDDEALWFSSVLREVKGTILCFLGSRDRPEWKGQRERCLLEHPVKNVSSLGLEQAGVFNNADWQNPRMADYGLEIHRSEPVQALYQGNFAALMTGLRPRLSGCRNVITHNPWGEYGHEEHIQVYLALRMLQKELGFELWFSNYCSNRSCQLMLRYVSGFAAEYLTLPTDEGLGKRVMALYQHNDCWTWFDDYHWFAEESFMKDRGEMPVEPLPRGRLFPLNFLKMELEERKDVRKPGWKGRMKRKCARIVEAVKG